MLSLRLGASYLTQYRSLTKGIRPAPRLRADQVTIEEYRSNPAKYTFPITEGPKPEVGSAVPHKVRVDQPAGEIHVEVFTPTDDAIQAGKLKTTAGLPAHVDYHGGRCDYILVRALLTIGQAAG